MRSIGSMVAHRPGVGHRRAATTGAVPVEKEVVGDPGVGVVPRR
jgi:hypothetical protein